MNARLSQPQCHGYMQRSGRCDNRGIVPIADRSIQVGVGFSDAVPFRYCLSSSGVDFTERDFGAAGCLEATQMSFANRPGSNDQHSMLSHVVLSTICSLPKLDPNCLNWRWICSSMRLTMGMHVVPQCLQARRAPVTTCCIAAATTG
jgi:hypothetical protein